MAFILSGGYKLVNLMQHKPYTAIFGTMLDSQHLLETYDLA